MNFEKTFVKVETIFLRFFQFGFLSKTKNFDMQSAFSKNPGFTFSEGLGLDSGPRDKMCHIKPIY